MTAPIRDNKQSRCALAVTGVGAAVTAGLAGCTGTDSPSDPSATDGPSGGSTDDDAYGLLSTSITDQPNDIGDFESLIVTLDGIWVKPDTDDGADTEEEDTDVTETETSEGTESTDETETESVTPTATESTGETADTATATDSDANGADDDDEGGRRYIEFEEPQEADLVELQDGNTALIDETELEVGSYQFLQLDVANTEGTLTDGSEAEVETPGNAPLKFNQSFDIRADVVTNFLADFAPNRRGNGSYIIRPVASGTEVTYTDGTTADDGTEDPTASESGAGDAETTTDTESPSSATQTDSPATTPSGTEDSS